MIKYWNFNRGRFRLESFEIFSTPETTCFFKPRVVTSEKKITISINKTDFKVKINTEEGKNPYEELENSFFNGEKIACQYKFKDDIIDGPGPRIDVSIQYKDDWVLIEKI